MTTEEYKESLFGRIKVLNETIWEHKVRKNNVDKWLENFHDEAERLPMLHLLSEFMYFGSIQMRQLLKVIYRDSYRYQIIEQIRRSLADSTDSTLIEAEFSKLERNTRFFGIGNPSESGAHLLYFFRQENKLSKKLFINTDEIFNRTDPHHIKIKDPLIKYYVFIDDFCGTGSQVSLDNYLSSTIKTLRSIDPNIKIYYLMLMGTTKGINVVKKTNYFDHVEAAVELDESFMCFSPTSRYFTQSNPFVDAVTSKGIALKYGSPLIKNIIMSEGAPETQARNIAPDHALGFNNCQLLIGFHHNTPDNSLPIIWYDEDDHPWMPIFRRYNKKYEF